MTEPVEFLIRKPEIEKDIVRSVSKFSAAAFNYPYNLALITKNVCADAKISRNDLDLLTNMKKGKPLRNWFIERRVEVKDAKLHEPAKVIINITGFQPFTMFTIHKKMSVDHICYVLRCCHKDMKEFDWYAHRYEMKPAVWTPEHDLIVFTITAKPKREPVIPIETDIIIPVIEEPKIEPEEKKCAIM